MAKWVSEQEAINSEVQVAQREQELANMEEAETRADWEEAHSMGIIKHRMTSPRPRQDWSAWTCSASTSLPLAGAGPQTPGTST
jgi:hypothetical protein